MLGSPGQSNYAAANAFLDALAHERRRSGRPALSINWGPFDEAGLAARANSIDRLAMRGMSSMPLSDGCTVLAHLMKATRPPVQVGVLPLNLRQWREFYPKDASSPFFSALGEGAEKRERGASSLREHLAALDVSRRLVTMEEAVRGELAKVLRTAPENIDRHTVFTNMGLDSLLALEVRNRLEQMSGLSLPTTLLWKHASLAPLSQHLLERLFADRGDNTGQESDRQATAGPNVEDGLEQLSQSELASLLADELSDGRGAG
jgi:acyl carrier protein